MGQPLEALHFPGQFLEVFTRFLQQRECDVKATLSACGLDPEALSAPDAILTGAQLRAMLRVCREQADPARPLSAQLLHHVPITALGTLGMVIMASPSMEAALDAALRFYPVILPAYEVRRGRLGDQVHLLFSLQADFGEVSEDLTETVLGAVARICRFVMPAIGPLEIHLQHDTAFDTDTWEALFAPDKVRFGQPANQIILPARLLHEQLATSSQTTLEQFRQQLEKQAEALKKPGGFSQAIRNYLVQSLRQRRNVNVEEVARVFRMSSRTLGRRLRQEGVTFRQLSQEARIDHAEFLLLNSQRPVNQIARLSGFTNESSFARAFRKRKGVSPTEMRRG
ncbi:AraC family transcriptional regulator [Hahella sp. SMD15-11]|uniref:AraC family transcriptional regulator n=1 Tax=Thermohahella caldifontis TaxID=3142973 RepID=A0AB39UU29_9GAMM